VVALLAIGITVYRAWGHRGMHPDVFWALKKSSQSRAEVVVTGDSRIVEGVCPAAMRRCLGGLRVLNFGFNGIGYSEQYLAATLRALSTNGDRRIVIMGITPLSLTPRACRSNRFSATPDESPQKLAFCQLVGQAYFGLDNLRGRGFDSRDAENEALHWTYHEDGWVASSLVSTDSREEVHKYRNVMFRDNQVSPAVVARVAEFVRRCASEKIEVYAFRPPATPALDEVEDSLGGFDERSVAATLQDAGAKWLAFCRDRYDTWDGCHLQSEPAAVFSEELAGRIQRP